VLVPFSPPSSPTLDRSSRRRRTVRVLPAAVDPMAGDLAARLASHLALHARAAIPPDEAARYAEQVFAARAEWNANFGGVQFTLGRAWYTHLETGTAAAYFADAAASDARVERAVPGLQARIVELGARLLREPVVRRPRWCGPGVHIFTPGNEVSSKGGDVHYDVEGLTPEQLERRADAYSFVLMLQPCVVGGGLRLHDRMYAGDPYARAVDEATPSEVIAYQPGDLVVFDSYRLHQILPFGGDRARVSATFHVARLPDGRAFESWF
jgi:hypothetical protein